MPSRTFNGRLAFVGSMALLLTGFSGAASAQNCQQQCTGQSSECYELRTGNQTIYARCVTQCEQKCEGPPAPPPVTFNTKYLVLGLVYAPPGCTGSSSTGCGKSLVDYAGGSSLGSKVSVKDSFKTTFKISADSSSDMGSASAEAGFSGTQADSESYAITKTSGRDVQVLGNGDAIDHGQDMFILLLNPTVTLRQDKLNIYWKPGYSGTFPNTYEVYVSELRNPATMRPSVASVLKNLNFTNEDYQTILSIDPYGGCVQTGTRTTVVGGCRAVATTGGPTALDGTRFHPLAWTLPYQPPLKSPSCNNGVCACPATTVTLKNDLLDEYSHEADNEYTVGITVGVGVPKVWDLKTEWDFTWTNSSTTSNTTDATQSASATISCPSVNYTDTNTEVAVYWDALFGTFMFILYDPSTTAIVNRGKVVDASGKPLAGQPVELTYDGKTYHTVTAANGTYLFQSAAGHPLRSPTGRIAVRNVAQAVTLRATEPTTSR